MNRKMKIFVTGLIFASFFLSVTPLVNIAAAVDQPDLIVTQCIVQEHWLLNNWWTAKVKVKNIGDYDADSFKVRLTQYIHYTGNPPSIGSEVVHEWNFWNGLDEQVESGWKTKNFYWNNPNPQYYFSQCEAFADCYDDEDQESNENNNKKFSNTFY